MPNNRLWMPKAINGGVYLTHHIGRSKSECIEKIMQAASRELFYGTIDERLRQLSWVIVEVEFFEVA